MGKNIIIIGGGFAGIHALSYLGKNRDKIPEGYQLILIDPKKNFEFLPMLPDLLASWLKPKRTRVDLKQYCAKRDITFINGIVSHINLKSETVHCQGQEIEYNYLIIASGSQPNFFGNQNTQQNCYTINTVDDAVKIKHAIEDISNETKEFDIVVVGGGYTGIECATNALYFCRKNNFSPQITIIEKAPTILPMVPEWMRDYTLNTLKKLGISIINGAAVQKYENQTVFLDNDDTIKNAVCVWSAGVTGADLIKDLPGEKIKGRVKIDKHLNIDGYEKKNIFLIGDSGVYIDTKTNSPLRMGIQFSIDQGTLAGKNVINRITGRQMKPYKPVDLGYVIPLTYGKAPGLVLEKNVNGVIGFFLHYFMCIYRSFCSNKLGIIQDILSKRIFKK